MHMPHHWVHKEWARGGGQGGGRGGGWWGRVAALRVFDNLRGDLQTSVIRFS